MTIHLICAFVYRVYRLWIAEIMFSVAASSKELGWLGHFVKKSTRLERFCIHGLNIFDGCSEQSVDRFFEDLGSCNHIKKMNFTATDLAEIIYKLGPAMKNNGITRLYMKEWYLGIQEIDYLFNAFRDMNSLEDLCFDCELDGDDDLDDDDMAGYIPSLAAHSAMRILTLKNLNMGRNSCAVLSGILPRMAGLHELHLGGNSSF